MLIMAVIGTSIALLKPQLLWIFLISGTLAAAGLFPTILSLYWGRLNAKGAFWSVFLSIIIATPLSIYANVSGNENLVTWSAIASVGIGAVIAITAGLLNKGESFDFGTIKDN